jgi:magnesium-transporting ATPase (P-type)
MEKKKNKEQKEKGFGFWLIFFAVGLVIGIITLLGTIYEMFVSGFILLTIIYVSYFIFLCITLSKFVNRMKIFPLLGIISMWSIWVIILALSIFYDIKILDVVNGGELIAVIISGTLWTIYLIESKRVKRIFVN